MKCPICHRQFKTRAALQQHQAARCGAQRVQPQRVVTQRVRPIRRQAVTSVTGNDSTLVVSAEELAYPVVNQENQITLNLANQLVFWPGRSGLARLDQYGQMFEQYHVDHLEVKYRTSSGTVVSGAIITAFDYEATDVATTLGGIQVQQPRIRVPVWENGSFTVDINRANKSRWMYTAGGIPAGTNGFTSAGAIISSAPASQTDTQYGDVWVKYRVTFTGPTTSQNNVAVAATGKTTQVDDAWTVAEGNAGSDFVDLTPSGDNLGVFLKRPGDYLASFFSQDWNIPSTNSWRALVSNTLRDLGFGARALNDYGTPGIARVLLSTSAPASFNLQRLHDNIPYFATISPLPAGSTPPAISPV